MLEGAFLIRRSPQDPFHSLAFPGHTSRSPSGRLPGGQSGGNMADNRRVGIGRRHFIGGQAAVPGGAVEKALLL